ncbi:hypothetical protein [Agrobacterium pusense]|uniref:hypothetical protein n=1 Tax=Agrobacterium pusense TaxID=648995 RepID=UPI000D3A007E|nr:hypothetical protein [Agrobacterium pusense]PTV70244.1 hypothetical protein DBL06_25610 [Agrobacterium pusense]
MSAGNQKTGIEGYYDVADLEAQALAAEEAKKKVISVYGPTARMAGESVEQYEEMRRKLEDEAARKPQKMYYRDEEVARLAAAQLNAARTKAFNALVKSLPKPIARQFQKGEDVPQTVDELPHLASATLGRITLIDKDGSRSLVHVCIANFTPGAIDPEEHRFRDIPDQRGKTSKDNKPVTYLIGRRINADGTLGPVDTRFAAKNGSAQMTSKLAEVQKAVYDIGANNIAIIKEQRAAAAKQQAAPVTAQFGSQADRDAFRARQARLRAMEDGRSYGRDQEPDAGRSFGR